MASPFLSYERVVCRVRFTVVLTPPRQGHTRTVEVNPHQIASVTPAPAAPGFPDLVTVRLADGSSFTAIGAATPLYELLRTACASTNADGEYVRTSLASGAARTN